MACSRAFGATSNRAHEHAPVTGRPFPHQMDAAQSAVEAAGLMLGAGQGQPAAAAAGVSRALLQQATNSTRATMDISIGGYLDEQLTMMCECAGSDWPVQLCAACTSPGAAGAISTALVCPLPLAWPQGCCCVLSW